MAMLIPLLLPHVVAAGANIGMIGPQFRKANADDRSRYHQRPSRGLFFSQLSDRQEGILNQETM